MCCSICTHSRMKCYVTNKSTDKYLWANDRSLVFDTSICKCCFFSHLMCCTQQLFTSVINCFHSFADIKFHATVHLRMIHTSSLILWGNHNTVTLLIIQYKKKKIKPNFGGKKEIFSNYCFPLPQKLSFTLGNK